NTRRPNNVWVGLEGDVERAALLAQHVEAECGALGFARDERGFTPHLTLGRVKRDAPNSERATLGKVIEKISPDRYGLIHARAVYLIASDLQPRGPVYTILSENLFREASSQ
ncbi:MAG: hypothetical protein L0Y55_16410, partial [Anaerolineales bacterium]|nr:hypothetical protein [Anaerolineales bacterium]